jgi:hypothetical protein
VASGTVSVPLSNSSTSLEPGNVRPRFESKRKGIEFQSSSIYTRIPVTGNFAPGK